MAKKEKLQLAMFDAKALSSLELTVKLIKRTWNLLPAEKQQQASKFLKEKKFLESFEDLDALLGVSYRTAWKLYNALENVLAESKEFKEFLRLMNKEQ